MTFPKIEPLEARIAPATISIAGVSIPEGDSGTTAANFTVTLSEAASEQITVELTTSDGTAVSTGAFADYAPAAGTVVTFEIGESSKDVSVAVNGDEFLEPNQNFTATLSNPSGVHTITTATATGTITNDDTAALVTISAAPDVTEGAGVTSEFTITLSHPVETDVTVSYTTGATGDTARPAPGVFTDYLAKTGTATFPAGGATTQTVSVAITDDPFREGEEQFTVTLSNPTNAALGATLFATGKILNDSDTTVGLALGDVQKVEGNTANNARLTATLSATLATPVGFALSTLNGTAVAGADFTAVTLAPVTIAADTLSADFNLAIVGDSGFEATESFFVNLTGAPAGVTVVNDHPLVTGVQATARVTLFNDDTQQLTGQKVQWIDADGDLVTLSVSKGSLPLTNTTLFTFVASGTVGGRILQKLDFANFGSAFAGASITITATRQAGFPNASDGRVDVGFIQATIFDPDELRAFGVDLGQVRVDGDLAKITAGDSFSTPAISRLDVYSLGAHGATTLPSGESFESKVLGPISTVLVKQNLEGYLHVIGSQFGTIGTLKIGGELKGGDTASSGRVAVSGRLGTATIGKIAGGNGDSSGVINGLLGSTASLGSITVLGDIVGGGGQVSGAILAPRIGTVKAGSLLGGSAMQSGIIISQSTLGNVTLTGDLAGHAAATASESGQISSGSSLGAVKIGGKIQGGGGADSGAILSGTSIASLSIGNSLIGGAGAGSGSVRAAVNGSGQATGATGNLGSVTLGEDAAHDSIKGGSGTNSGRIDVAGQIASFTSAGNVLGGAGTGSGGIVAGGSIGKLLIKRSLVGGDSSASAFLDKSGFISALRLGSATINEDIRSGVNGGAGIASSGAIRADVIDALTIRGNLTGNTSPAGKFSPVVISATGLSTDLAITSLTILGNAKFTEILAGYNAVASASNFRGATVNGDASIGSVLIGGTVLGVNLVAGGKVGTDARFGSADDAAITATVGVKNDPAIISKIASLVIKGSILANPTGVANSFGVVAQSLGSITLGAAGTPVALQAGAGNDRTPIVLGGATNFHALELALA